MALTLTTEERAELERRVRSLKIRSEDARRARVILMLAHGDSYSRIEATVPCYRDYINRWRRRFLADRLEGLRPRYRGQPPTVLTPAMEARVLEKTQVELWFSKIERDLLARGIFTSVPDLARKIRRYIRHYNQAAKPIRWSYRNPAHRISSTSASTVR